MATPNVAANDLERRIDAAIRAERDRLASLVHGFAEGIENVPLDRVTQSVALIAAAVEPLVRVIGQVFGRRDTAPSTD